MHGFAGRSMIGHVLAATAPLDAAADRRRRRAPARSADRSTSTRSRPAAETVVQERAARHRARRADRARPPSPAERRAAPSSSCPATPRCSSRRPWPRCVPRTHASGAAVTLLTSSVDDPTGYGRVVRDARRRGDARVVEHKDATRRPARDHRGRVRGLRLRPRVPARRGRAPVDRQRPGRAVPARRRRDRGRGRTARPRRHRAGRPRPPASTTGCSWPQAHRVYNARLLERAHAGRRHRRSIRPRPGSTPTSTLEPDATLLPGVQLHGATAIAAGAVIGPDTTLTDTAVGAAQPAAAHGRQPGRRSAPTSRSARSPTCARAPCWPTRCTSAPTSRSRPARSGAARRCRTCPTSATRRSASTPTSARRPCSSTTTACTSTAR